MVEQHDCSNLPAEFEPNVTAPTVKAEEGALYGQVFPAKSSTAALPAAEIHYYHLWRRDCGPHGHPLDTEHVSVLVSASQSQSAAAKWKADYWYAGAHENTICDVSHLARAATLQATDHGARVWISQGKHASYLNPMLCQAGCAADRCANTVALHTAKIINLGDPGHPMNGATFAASSQWPLLGGDKGLNLPTNYQVMADSSLFWPAVGFTLEYTVLATVLLLGMGLGLALLIQSGGRWRGFLRTAFLLPSAMGLASASLLFYGLYSNQIGPINSILETMHLSSNPIQFFPASLETKRTPLASAA